MAGPKLPGKSSAPTLTFGQLVAPAVSTSPPAAALDGFVPQVSPAVVAARNQPLGQEQLVAQLINLAEEVGPGALVTAAESIEEMQGAMLLEMLSKQPTIVGFEQLAWKLLPMSETKDMLYKIATEFEGEEDGEEEEEKD